MGSADLPIKEVAGYRLTERIGSGGMGDVYKAHNAALNRDAAVKILHQTAYVDRFRNEAYIQASINHPNIARLYEYTEAEGKHCIVMEYAEGESLGTLLHRKGRLSSAETENILRQLVSALAYLHKKEIIHRDIKPQNFKVQSDGTVKMLDFGIAKHKYSPKLTQQGFVVGTMEYLAPEQFEQKEELKSDIWSLGVMTYELLTGYMPFEASNPLTLRTNINRGNYTDPKILVPDISEKLSDIIDKCFKVNPANRISAAAIEQVLGKHGFSAGGKLQLPAMKLPSKKMMGYIAAVAAVALLVLFVLNNKPGIRGNDSVPEAVKPVMPQSGEKREVLISVPGVNNAELISAENERLPIPHTVSGKDGDRFEFTIHADGYLDKKVEVVISPRRSSFEYNLDKINN